MPRPPRERVSTRIQLTSAPAKNPAGVGLTVQIRRISFWRAQVLETNGTNPAPSELALCVIPLYDHHTSSPHGRAGVKPLLVNRNVESQWASPNNRSSLRGFRLCCFPPVLGDTENPTHRLPDTCNPPLGDR